MAAKVTEAVSRGLAFRRIASKLFHSAAFPKLPAESCGARKPNSYIWRKASPSGSRQHGCKSRVSAQAERSRALDERCSRPPSARSNFYTALYFAIVFLLWIIPTWLIVQLIADHRAAGRFTHSSLKLLFFLIGCKVQVIGKEHMGAPGPKIYASNHTSYIDVVALMRGLGVPYRFVAKMEVSSLPFIGAFMRHMGHLSFNRTDGASRLRQAAEMEEILRQGESVFVFPEGTFTRDPGVHQFQLGAFKAAVETGAPIIPVSLRGTREFLPDGKIFPRPSNITITLSAPIIPQKSRFRIGG